jgi:hypothetical protein
MSWVRRSDVRAASIIVFLLLLLGNPLLAGAHSDPFAPGSIAPPSQHLCQGSSLQVPMARSPLAALPWVSLTFLLSVLIAVAVVHGMRQWRRVVVFGLVLMLATFTFGTAVHSVHHLSEPQKAAECPVFSASQHISGTLAEPGALYVPMLAIAAAFPGTCEAPTFTLCFQPAQPRAPPLSPPK